MRALLMDTRWSEQIDEYHFLDMILKKGAPGSRRWIDAGWFRMGSESGLPDEKPVHEVKLSKGYYLQTTEVTQAQWVTVMGTNPSSFRGAGPAGGERFME